MTRKRACLIVMLSCALAMAAAAQNPQPNLQDLFQSLVEGANLGAQTPPAELVDFRKMKELMPKTIGELKRTGLSGEKSTAPIGNLAMAMAEATYSDGSDGTVTIKVTDLGAMPGIAAMSHAAWANAQIDRETDEESERTLKFKGYKAHEKYNTRFRNGQFSVMPDKRLVIEIKGRNVERDVIQQAVEALPIKEFLALIPAAGPPADAGKDAAD